MHEKELRLALVCYGGASLAVYMNGISNEILKLVRASRSYHQIADREARKSATYGSVETLRNHPSDSEDLYFDLLKLLGHKIDLRVVVDIVSGTSAGGINGIFLARALAHDLSFDPLRTMWLELGDVEKLMDDQTIAGKWSKAYIYPFVSFIQRKVLGRLKTDENSKRKFSRFIRSKWFHPPFSGETMLKWMLDACENMGNSDQDASLLPSGHRLDLFVSLTNFYGRPRRLKLHDPQEISEREHRVNISFTYLNSQKKAALSQFTEAHIPGLGFAARATSSFPGAFPPVQLKHLDTMLKKRKQSWPAKDDFVRKNFKHFRNMPDELANVSFIDGGVTNNKPFQGVISAIQERPAHREVDRRIIYVEPLPDDPDKIQALGKDTESPGFFKNILGSLTTIPRNEPIYDDLRVIEQHNALAKNTDLVSASAQEEVQLLIAKNLKFKPNKKIDEQQLASWRDKTHELAKKNAGFSYANYRQIKTIRILERLAKLTAKLVLTDEVDDYNIALEHLVEWAYSEGILNNCNGHTDTLCEALYIKFLKEFDVDFRMRRLRFMIKRVNRLQSDHGFDGISDDLQNAKREIYLLLERYKSRWQQGFYTDFWEVEKFSSTHIPTVLTKIAGQMFLEDLDAEADLSITNLINQSDDEKFRECLFHGYIGFSFYDILALPMMTKNDLYEMEEIRIDRISPLDCKNISGKSETAYRNPLLGTELGNFGAFFSRKARENDYIWGRLHGAHRMIDFLIDSAGPDALPKSFDIKHFRKRLYRRILEAEKQNMLETQELIDQLLDELC
ncbi:patatin-like protein [Kordiimonas sp. SCSIO 12610]|uniref:patatin-like protein n=1 Tax=Kordiimonas sp. SCSIO 12610 TaxID=2829597 RepID=UPI00210C7F4F|nr:patatin-like protein [Kordiimonas sp. SCSIO 12610]UTW54850.1 patatin-like protein [Kordiimonas sp. SCSIO 12610]